MSQGFERKKMSSKLRKFYDALGLLTGVEGLKLRLIFLKPGSHLLVYLCADVEVTCVCGMCGDVYVDVCLNAYGMHMCVRL